MFLLNVGFRIGVLGCKGSGAYCHLPEEMHVVTRCGWSQPMEDLTITQIAGLFLNMYTCGEGACSVSSITKQTDFKKMCFKV